MNDNITMAESLNFTDKLKDALKAKSDWLNAESLPKMLEHYRLLHACVKNIYETLIKRSLITPDPYKLEIKISEISSPDDSHFVESERPIVMGSRFSNYESMLDYVCTYVKFSTEYITIPQIKKMIDLNNAFQWHNMTLNNSRTNSRAMATLIQEVRHSAPQLTVSMINDSITKSAKAIAEINDILKDLMLFQREAYKVQIRHDVIEHPKFNREKAGNSQADEIAEIKKNLSSISGKMPYYTELIQEIAAEDLAADRQKLQEQTLMRLAIAVKTEKNKKVSVDYKQYLLECLHILSGLGELYSTISDKIQSNVNIIENQKNTLFHKIAVALRKLFNLSEPPLVYDFIIVDQKKDTKTHRNVDMIFFISSLVKKSSFFMPLANLHGPEFSKIKKYSEQNILDYLNKSLTENQEILTLLAAADEFFKQNVEPHDRSKIKGLKIDLISVKNIIVKAIQKRSEYVGYIEEQEQMQKLGITNEI